MMAAFSFSSNCLKGTAMSTDCKFTDFKVHQQDEDVSMVRLSYMYVSKESEFDHSYLLIYVKSYIMDMVL